MPTRNRERNERNADQPIDGLLKSGGTLRELAAGEALFRQGDKATAIYKVESGQLRLVRRTVDDHLVVLHTARPGEFFAEPALFSDVYHCDAVAVVASRIRAFAKAAVRQTLRASPMVAEAFAARLAHQLQDLRARMELRNIKSARDRVLQYLRLRAGSGSRRVALEGRLQDIAAEVGLSREAFYRTLAALEADGSLTRTESEITLGKSPGT
jgi:CRP-like cAMP-binding protein